MSPEVVAVLNGKLGPGEEKFPYPLSVPRVVPFKSTTEITAVSGRTVAEARAKRLVKATVILESISKIPLAVFSYIKRERDNAVSDRSCE